MIKKSDYNSRKGRAGGGINKNLIGTQNRNISAPLSWTF